MFVHVCFRSNPIGDACRGQSRAVPLMHYRTQRRHLMSDDQRTSQQLAAMKANQSAKIREFAQALAVAGIVSLDDQTRVLGLSRSTAWTIISGAHKSTGISATLIDRMLASPTLPQPLRAKIIEYVEEKAAGRYGHSRAQRRRFVESLATKLAVRRQLGSLPRLQPDIDVETSSRTALTFTADQILKMNSRRQ
jgi:predicted DNA-binding transcriptional regulator AlpA